MFCKHDVEKTGIRVPLKIDKWRAKVNYGGMARKYHESIPKAV